MNYTSVTTEKEECLPIEIIDEVVNWKKPSNTWAELVKPLMKRTEYCYPSYPICSSNSEPVSKKASDVPKTLVCHDMKGGYGADRWVGGTDNPEEYKFLSWPCIDIFVYFSHKLVTIPPLCWINAGHTHGVKVLGTIITEGKCGLNIWEDLSVDEIKLNKFAIQLAEICHHYGFDGYLINIENKMSYRSMELLIHFLELLIKTLKNNSTEKMVIWYDAVTYPFGELRWQNQLNFMNRKFFDICDGIFLNYGWSEEDLILSVKEAGERKTDVYVGIDVFGRGVYGGGGFTTCEAMNPIRNQGLSAAIFAPGWVFEKCEVDECADNRDFMFWELLMDYVYCYGPAQLPFQTSFCRGYGLRKYKEGMIVSDYPWFNLSEMNHMPGLLSGMYRTEESSCVLYYQDDAYNGGGCLLIKPQKPMKTHSDRLFICDFFFHKGKKILIKFITKPISKNCDSGINLIVNLVDHKDCDNHSEEKIAKKLVLPIKYENNSESLTKWIISEFSIDIGCAHIISFDCTLENNSSPVLIGYLSVEGEDLEITESKQQPIEGCMLPYTALTEACLLHCH